MDKQTAEAVKATIGIVEFIQQIVDGSHFAGAGDARKVVTASDWLASLKSQLEAQANG